MQLIAGSEFNKTPKQQEDHRITLLLLFRANAWFCFSAQLVCTVLWCDATLHWAEVVSHQSVMT